MPTLQGHPPLEIVLRRSGRARRLSLRVSRLDGRITLSLPAHVREAEAMRFVRAEEAWIRKAVTGAAVRSVVALGSVLPVAGRMLVLEPGTGRTPVVEGERLLVPGDPAQVGVRVAALLKLIARDRLAEASDRYAERIGRRYTRLSLRDTRSRWGSCTAAGGLMYSWRLAMAPPEVLDYVAAHEVAHLAEMNHSRAFWDVVEGSMPDYARHRRWLKREGHLLHAYRFG